MCLGSKGSRIKGGPFLKRGPHLSCQGGHLSPCPPAVTPLTPLEANFFKNPNKYFESDISSVFWQVTGQYGEGGGRPVWIKTKKYQK